MTAKLEVKVFFDKRTFSVQYVVSDPETGKCAIIDPVLDYDEKSGATGPTMPVRCSTMSLSRA